MAVETPSTAALLDSLTDALSSATTAFPTDETTLLPPTSGISLLDVKNDLLLSYLHNLVFLILLRLRDGNNAGSRDQNSLGDEVVKKLIELRVYMERGVRPLEGKLRYQVDKVLRAAEDAERHASQNSTTKKTRKPGHATRRRDQDSSEVSNDESASEEESEAEGDEEAQETVAAPRAAALMRKAQTSSDQKSASRASATGAYRPPRITPTAMPLPPSVRDRDSDRPSRRRKSNLLNEYIEEEVSTAPRAQPSIGSNNTILGHGRGGLSSRDREKERERTEYEERNFTRLAPESKAERRKAKARGERDRRDMFGGEDWTGLGGMGDRINQSVTSKGSSVLQRREKRRRDTGDGPRGDGTAIGDSFEKRRKVMDDRAHRKRGKR